MRTSWPEAGSVGLERRVDVLVEIALGLARREPDEARGIDEPVDLVAHLREALVGLRAVASRSFGPRPSRSARFASRLWRRMRSWSAWRSPPARVARIRISSVAMNGSSARRRERTTPSFTTSPRPDVRHEAQDGVGGEEALGEEEPTRGGVVERALEPLRGGRGAGRRDEREQVAREGGRPLRAHRVALVRHRGGADLLVLERLRELADAREQPHVVREAGDADRDAAERGHHLPVLAPGVGLARDRHRRREPRAPRDALVERLDLGRVAVEEREEGGLRPRRALRPEEGEPRADAPHLGQVVDEVEQPEAGALADRRGLRGLEVGVGEAGEVLPPSRERGDRRDRLRQPRLHERQRVAQRGSCRRCP